MNNIAFGAIIQANRLYQNITLRSLAEMAQVDAGQLSKIERGLEFSETKIKVLMNALDINYERILEEISDIDLQCSKVIDSIFNIHPIEETEKIFNDLWCKYRSDFVTPMMLITKFSLSVILENSENDITYYAQIIEKMRDSLTYREYLIYCQYMGIFLYDRNELTKSLDYLNKIVEGNAESDLQAMALYYQGQAYRKLNNLFKATLCIEKAMNLFKANNNFGRCAYCLIVLGNIAFMYNDFNEAEKLYQETLKIYQVLNVKQMHKTLVICSILSLNVSKKKYHNFLKQYEELDECTKIQLKAIERFNINMLICMYKTKLYDECEELIKNELKSSKTYPLTAIRDYIHEKIKKKSSNNKAIRHLLCAKKYLESNFNFADYKTIIEFLLEEYSIKKDYGKMIELYEKLNDKYY